MDIFFSVLFVFVALFPAFSDFSKLRLIFLVKERYLVKTSRESSSDNTQHGAGVEKGLLTHFVLLFF